MHGDLAEGFRRNADRGELDEREPVPGGEHPPHAVRRGQAGLEQGLREGARFRLRPQERKPVGREKAGFRDQVGDELATAFLRCDRRRLRGSSQPCLDLVGLLGSGWNLELHIPRRGYRQPRKAA